MKKSFEHNDIEAKNSSIIQNGNISLDNGKNYGMNIVKTQPTIPDENQKTVRRIQKVKAKAQGVSEIIAKFAVLAVAGVGGVIGIDALTPSPIKAEISYVEAYDTEVFYNINLSELADNLKIVLYNDFTNREQKIEEQAWEGVFENLQTNMKYTLVIKHGSKVLAKQTLVTKTREEEPVEEEPNTDPTEEINVGDDSGQYDPTTSDPNGTNQNNQTGDGTSGDDSGVQTSDGSDENGRDPTGAGG